MCCDYRKCLGRGGSREEETLRPFGLYKLSWFWKLSSAGLYQGREERMYGGIMACSPRWYNQLWSTQLMAPNPLFPDINSNQQSKCPTIHNLLYKRIQAKAASLPCTPFHSLHWAVQFFFLLPLRGSWTGRVKKIKHRLRGTNEKEECHFFWEKENIPPVH